jgi:hypothetical protein
MGYAVHLEPCATPLSAVAYKWQRDTEILSVKVARTQHPGPAAGGAQVVELTGVDGSWLLLDLLDGAIDGLEIAVWPSEVSTRALRRPVEAEHVRARLAPRDRLGSPHAGERTIPITVERDSLGETVRLRVGPMREARTVQLAQSLLLDVDPLDEIAGIWLLDVPPIPTRHPLS